ncbi:hypothetical protein F442_14355 [Phytophthora nicotianae P10297]|uniref:Uncharacterized protein n=1 Tax=Phytophthora nicotianae P10297 TaxID=1317064 RepID=W2YSF3_PHYNI|nr:hypothetical protein F442_14355 [Phytophthora nicotianae P10297]
MAGSVLRCVEDSTRVEDSRRTVIQDAVVERPHADRVETHPLHINPARQCKDGHSYSTIYTRHELSTLIGRDFEERLLRARDAQREDASIEYSPTSPPDDEDEDERGASGLPVVRRVLAATINGDTEAVPADEIEWILGSGAQVNVTGELQLLNNVMELQHAEILEGATGSCERIGIAGAVLMPVVNDLNGRVEMRLLEEVQVSCRRRPDKSNSLQ